MKLNRIAFLLAATSCIGWLSSADAETVNGIDLRKIESNGITMRIAEQGTGPVVLLLHGWPESWYSWRHQIPALAEAGYRAVAPDMRGYGESDAPEDVDDYAITTIAQDITGLLDALGEKQAVIVGHDWGALVAWNCAMLHPDRFRAVITMSVPYGGRAPEPPTDTWKRTYGENFFYILYFQEPGVAEAEFDANPHGILSMLYASPTTPRAAPTITDPKRAAGGWIGRIGAPKELPAWLKQEDLDYYVAQFKKSGFRGGINYYRNFDRNWRITEALQYSKVTQPTLFIAGERDVVIGGATKDQLTARMRPVVAQLKDVVLIPGVGHWVQQEAAAETNAAMLAFLKSIETP